MLPPALQAAADAGLPVWDRPYDANLVVLRDRGAPLDTFDGRIVLAWTIDGGAWREVDCRAATRPGTHYLQHPMNPIGTAMIAPGRHVLSHATGWHRNTPALVQVGRVRVVRDGDLDAELDPPATTYDTDGAGLNVHRIDDPAYLAGCIGVPPRELEELLGAWRALQQTRRQDRVSLVVVEV